MRNHRAIPALVIAFVLAAAAVPADLPGQTQAPTYRVILYLAEEGAPQQVQIQRLDEVWSEADGAQRLQRLLDRHRAPRRAIEYTDASWLRPYLAEAATDQGYSSDRLAQIPHAATSPASRNTKARARLMPVVR